MRAGRLLRLALLERRPAGTRPLHSSCFALSPCTRAALAALMHAPRAHTRPLWAGACGQAAEAAQRPGSGRGRGARSPVVPRHRGGAPAARQAQVFGCRAASLVFEAEPFGRSACQALGWSPGLFLRQVDTCAHPARPPSWTATSAHSSGRGCCVRPLTASPLQWAGVRVPRTWLCLSHLWCESSRENPAGPGWKGVCAARAAPSLCKARTSGTCLPEFIPTLGTGARGPFCPERPPAPGPPQAPSAGL